MKRFLLLPFLLFGVVLGASAQASLSGSPQAASARVQSFRSNGAENSGFGIKGGVNLSDLVGSNASNLYKDRKWVTQYHFGAYAQIGITNRFSIQPELLYQRKGFKAAEQLPTVGQNASASLIDSKTIKLSYLSVPVLFVFNVFDNVAIQLGPQASYLLNVREGSKQVDAETYHYKQFDIGAVGGIEAKIEFLRVGVRYDYSLTDLRDAGNFEDAANQVARQAKSDIKNGTLQVYLGLGL